MPGVVILYALGLSALLVTFLPFSPMTIDLVNLSRETQLAIWRYRKHLWGLTGVSWLIAIGWSSSLAAHGVVDGGALITLILASAAVMALLFWTGYVPFVMTPPDTSRHLEGGAANAAIASDETVLGLVLNGAACAYRRDQIARPHYFKDTLAGRDFIVSYCILCNSATAFETVLNDRALNLRCLTAFNNNIIYIDVDSGDMIQQLDARVIHGPHMGHQLTLLPVTITRWQDWQALYPQTRLYDAPPRTLRDRLVAFMLGLMIPISRLSRRDRPWHRIRGHLDPRLRAMQFVLGAEVNGDASAYALDDVRAQSVVEDVIGDTPVVVLHDDRHEIAQMFSRTVDDIVLRFRPCTVADAVAEDFATGSLWDISGRATSGPYKGRQLTPLPHFNKLFWFSWALFKPHTRLFTPASANQRGSRP